MIYIVHTYLPRNVHMCPTAGLGLGVSNASLVHSKGGSRTSDRLGLKVKNNRRLGSVRADNAVQPVSVYFEVEVIQLLAVIRRLESESSKYRLFLERIQIIKRHIRQDPRPQGSSCRRDNLHAGVFFWTSVWKRSGGIRLQRPHRLTTTSGQSTGICMLGSLAASNNCRGSADSCARAPRLAHHLGAETSRRI